MQILCCVKAGKCEQIIQKFMRIGCEGHSMRLCIEYK